MLQLHLLPRFSLMVHVKPHIGNKLYISSSWFHPLHITLEFLEFVLNVYFQSGVYRFVVVTQNLEPLRKAIKVGNKMAYPKVHSGPFGKSKQGECPFCGTQIFSCLFPSLLFLDTISCLMTIKHNMSSVRYEKAYPALQTFSLLNIFFCFLTQSS